MFDRDQRQKAVNAQTTATQHRARVRAHACVRVKGRKRESIGTRATPAYWLSLVVT